MSIERFFLQMRRSMFLRVPCAADLSLNEQAAQLEEVSADVIYVALIKSSFQQTTISLPIAGHHS
jgi:hypothetical protein